MNKTRIYNKTALLFNLTFTLYISFQRCEIFNFKQNWFIVKQGFLYRAILVSLGQKLARGERRDNFKILDDFKSVKLTLDILKLQMRARKKGSQEYLLVILKLILNVLELQIKNKKNVSGVFISNFDTYTK